MGKNERTKNRNETNRIDQKNREKKTSFLILASLLYLTQERFYLCRAVSRTHARTTTPNKKDSIHPSIHSSLTASHGKVYLLATKGNLGHGIRGRPTNQSERARNIFILSRPYHRVRLHLTSARLISAHRSRRRRRRRERRRLSNHRTTTLRRIRPDPVFSSIHSTTRYVTSW